MQAVIKVLLNSIFSFIFLFIIAKLLGKKQVAQLTVVDYIVGISIGSIAAQWCFDTDIPWYNFAIGMAIYFIFSLVIDFLERKTIFKHLLKGKQILIVENGKINYKNLKKSKLDIDDMLSLLRQQNCFDLNDIAFCFFENNGNLSVLFKDRKTPTVKEDLEKLTLKASTLTYYPIIDGKIVYGVLEKIEKNEQWLLEKAGAKNKASLKNIILAEYDSAKEELILHYKL